MTDTAAEAEQVTIDRLAKVYIKIRDKRAALTREFEQEDQRMKAAQAEIANAMKDRLQELGVKSAKTEHGTITLSTKTRYYAQDWEAFGRFVVENDAPFLYEKRVAQGAMAEFLENNPGVVPPGLNTMSEVDVSVRKST